MILKVNNVSRFLENKKILSNINIIINQHENTAILGANGAGKSSVLQIISGNLASDDGNVTFFDKSISMVYLPHSGPSDPNLTVLQNLNWAKTLLKIEYIYDDDILKELINNLELSPLLYTKAKNLSHGEQKRLNLALTIFQKSDILLLDEPTLGLDPGQKTLVWNWLKPYLIKSRTTLVLATNNLKEATELTERGVFLKNGAILWQDYWKNLSDQDNFTLDSLWQLKAFMNPNSEIFSIFQGLQKLNSDTGAISRGGKRFYYHDSLLLTKLEAKGFILLEFNLDDNGNLLSSWRETQRTGGKGNINKFISEIENFSINIVGLKKLNQEDESILEKFYL